MPGMKPKPSASKPKARRVSKPVPLGGVKKRKAPSEDQLWGAAKPVPSKGGRPAKKSPREMAATYRKKAQATRLTPKQRAAVVQREKERLQDKRAAISRRKFKESM